MRQAERRRAVRLAPAEEGGRAGGRELRGAAGRRFRECEAALVSAQAECVWVASVEREAWRLRIRTTDWRRLNAAVLGAPTLGPAPVRLRGGPRLLTAGR